MSLSSQDASLALWEESGGTDNRSPTRIIDAAPPEARRSGRSRLAINRIDPDPRNPRAPADADVEALAASIAKDGLLNAIVVRPTGDRYTIVAGHRRFAAWCHCAEAAPTDARWRTVDVVVRHIDGDEALTLMLVENLQRKALTPLEEAIALQRLRMIRGWSNRRVAEEIQKSEMYVSRRLRVLEDSSLCDAVLAGQLAITTAEELLAAVDRADLVDQAITHGWSPADARSAVQASRAAKSARPKQDESWRAHVAALDKLLDNADALPPASRREMAEAFHRLLNACQS